MKITIWQQFSSNHSASFTVVGTFETEEAAERAATNLREILQPLERWWDNLALEERQKWGDMTETEQLTPIEQRLQKELGVDWPYSLNWYHWVQDRQAVVRFENFLFIRPPGLFYYCGPQPFPQLLEKYNGRVDMNVSESRSHPDRILLMDIACTLPTDAEAAELLYESFREDFAAYHAMDHIQMDESYVPNIKWEISWYLCGLIADENLHILEVERHDQTLILRGININIFDDTCDTCVIKDVREYLENDGCANVQITFRTLDNYEWPEEDD